MINRGGQADPITISDYLESIGKLGDAGGRAHIATVASIPAPGMTRRHSEIVARHYFRRKAQKLGGQIIEWSQNPEIDTGMMLEMIQQKAYDLDDPSKEHRARDIGEDMDKFTARIDGRGIRGMETGYYDLDRKLGGLRPGNVYVFGGDPGMGKTTFALNVATNFAKRGDQVVFFSLEMGYEELKDRVACSLAHVDSSLLQAGELGPEECVKLADQYAAIVDMPIKIDDYSNTPGQMRSLIRRMKTPPKLIIVDYIQIMEPGTKYDSETTRITYNSKTLMRLAKEFNAPLIALSQLNRGEEARKKERRPTLASLRGSGSIEQDAYAAIFIYWRAHLFDPDQIAESEPEELRKAELIIAKNRGGQTGYVDLTFFKEYNLFESRIRYGT